jgi:hypothetical protein
MNYEIDDHVRKLVQQGASVGLIASKGERLHYFEAARAQ